MASSSLKAHPPARWTREQRAAAVDALFARMRVLPVVTIDKLDDAVPLARALLAGGLDIIEVTLRRANGLRAIRAISSELPQVRVGAGTVLDPAALDAACAAGAAFAVAPGATPELYAAAIEMPIPFIPAVATASEIMQGLAHGHSRLKFFPAAARGGVDALKAFAGPFPHVRFCATGGLDPVSAPAYLAQANVFAIGGSWMTPRDAIAARDWPRITALARTCAALVQ